MKTLIAFWRWLGLWRWRETRVCRNGFSTPWLVLFVGTATKEAQARAPEHTVEIDWSAVPQATHHRILWRTKAILVVVPWDNWIHRWFHACQDAGSNAAQELYWEQCGWSQTEGRDFGWEQRRAYRRAFRKEALSYWTIPLRCWWFGHQLEVDAYSAENGTEDISCTRCGWSHHAQF